MAPGVKNPPAMQEPQETRVWSLMRKITWSRKWQPVRERFILRNPVCCFLFLKGPLFPISSWETGTRRAAGSSQDWGHETERIRGFLSITFYFSVKLLSHVPISQNMDCLLALWHCYSPSYSCYGPKMIVISLVTVLMSLVLVFLLNFIFCLKLPCITIYKHTLPEIKHPCFTRDFGPPHPSFHHFLSVDSHPWVPVCKDHNSSAFPYSHLENPTDRGAWLATVRGITKSRTWLKHAPMHMTITFQYLNETVTTSNIDISIALL